MRRISKQFPGVTALDSVDLDAFPSEVVALIGENGAGKSTLMNILGGIHRADAGEIEIDGSPAAIRTVRDAAAQRIGFIHQELHLLGNLDIASNMFLGRELPRGGPLGLIDRKAMELETGRQLQRVGLRLSPRTLVGPLSQAQQQLIEIAKAVSSDVRLLIMDEPTSCLSLTETECLFDVIRHLRASGVTVIYISHRLREIEVIADRVVALRDGRNVGVLDRSAISHDNMVRLMVGRDLTSFSGRADRTANRVRLEVRNLRTKRFPSSEVSFTVQRGEILGIAGLIGSGRTEVARALFGIEPPIQGQILIDNEALSVQSAHDAINAGIFLAPEDRRNDALIVAMNIRENVTLADLRRYSSCGIVRRELESDAAQKLRERLKIKAPSIETAVASLSGGNQQKVVLAKWLSLAPRVVVFDEPTRGIDVGAKAEVYGLMRQLAEKGVAVIMISSEMEEILGNSDRVAVMHDGRITGILDRSECSEEAVMRLAVA